MLKIQPTMSAIPARREHVVTLLESVNSPLVNIPGRGASATVAFVVGVSPEKGRYRVYVFLRQPDNGGAVSVYVSEPGELDAAQFRTEESEATRFLQSMGFVMENKNFRALTDDAQQKEMSRVGIFEAPPVRPSVVELVDAVSEEVAVIDDGPDEIFGGLSREARSIFERAGLSVAPRPRSAPVPVGDIELRETGDLPSSERARGTGDLPPAAGRGTGDLHVITGDLVRSPTDLPQRTGSSDLPRGTGDLPGARTPPSPDADGLARLGRLLSTFALLLAFAPSCARFPDPEATVPPQVRNQIDIGNEHLAEQRWVQAVSEFSDLIETEGKFRDALYGLGVAYLNLGRVVEAEQNLREAVQADPAWSVSKNALATILLQTERCEEAQALLEKVIRDIFYTTPWFAEHNLAQALACRGEKKAAISRLQGLLAKQPQFCLGYLTLADLAAGEKMPALTIETCQAFHKECEQHQHISKLVSPEHSCLCYLRKGMAHAAMGDVDSARASFASCRSDGQYGKECQRSLELLSQ